MDRTPLTITLMFLSAGLSCVAFMFCMVLMFHANPGEEMTTTYIWVLRVSIALRLLFVIEEGIISRFHPASYGLYIALEVVCLIGSCAEPIGVIIFPTLTGMCMLVVPFLVALRKQE